MPRTRIPPDPLRQWPRRPLPPCLVSIATGPGSTLVARDSKKNESQFMGWSIPILRVSGIQLRIHVTFLLLIAWVALGSWSSAIFVLLLFLCVVLHEFG